MLNSLKYGDSKVIVRLFGRQTGSMSVVTSAQSSSRSRIKKQYFMPLSLIEVEVDFRQKNELQKLRDVRLLAPYSTIPFSPDKLAIALFCAEFLFHTLRSEERNDALFEYIADAMQWLDASPANYANFHLTFLMRLSRFLGFFPNISEASEGAVFDLRAASFSPQAPLHRDFLSASDSRALLRLMQMDFRTMHLFSMSHHDRNRILEILLRYYTLHLPNFPELRSVKVLQNLFD